MLIKRPAETANVPSREVRLHGTPQCNRGKHQDEEQQTCLFKNGKQAPFLEWMLLLLLMMMMMMMMMMMVLGKFCRQRLHQTQLYIYIKSSAYNYYKVDDPTYFFLFTMFFVSPFFGLLFQTPLA